MSIQKPLGKTVGLALALAAAGCVSTSREESPPDDPIQEMAADLVAIARQRIDLNSMRLAVHRLEELDPDVWTSTRRKAWQDGEVIREEIEHALVGALSERVNVVDVELLRSDREDDVEEPESVRAAANTYGSTHLVVGTFTPRGDEVVVNVRIVDADTFVIVAATRGVVPLTWLGDPSRWALLESTEDETGPVRVASLETPVRREPVTFESDVVAVPLGTVSSAPDRTRLSTRTGRPVAVREEPLTAADGSRPPGTERADAVAQAPLPVEDALDADPLDADSGAPEPSEAAGPTGDPGAETAALAEDDAPPTDAARPRVTPEGPAALRMRSIGRRTPAGGQ